MPMEYVMIPDVPDPRAHRAAPKPAQTDATTLYFDPHPSRSTAASLQRDSRPLGALEQMFAYYEA